MARFTGLRLLSLFAGIVMSAAGEDILIDFSGLNPGGYISYAGRTAPLVGSNINIDAMRGYGTPLRDAASEIVSNPGGGGGFVVENGRLNFQTGGFTERQDDGTFEFSGGGFLTVTGSIRKADGSYLISDPSTVLLQGGLLGATLDRVGSIKLTIVNGSDIKHPAVVSWFGLPDTTQFAFSGSITSKAQADALGRYPVLGAQILNAVVPEPATILLFGTALLFLGYRRRKSSSGDA